MWTTFKTNFVRRNAFISVVSFLLRVSQVSHRPKCIRSILVRACRKIFFHSCNWNFIFIVAVSFRLRLTPFNPRPPLGLDCMHINIPGKKYMVVGGRDVKTSMAKIWRRGKREKNAREKCDWTGKCANEHVKRLKRGSPCFVQSQRPKAQLSYQRSKAS